MTEDPSNYLLIGIDIGGTFTDFVIFDPVQGGLVTAKIPSTPANPADAVISGLKLLLETYPDSPVGVITHGSTVATNALLERKGAQTALVTTAGFRDVLEIGRQTREHLYDFYAQKPTPIIPRSRRFEVQERVDNQGAVIQPLDQQDLIELIETISLQPVESVAVCLLFSFLNPKHEQQIAERLRLRGLDVSLSSEILPEYREYERTSTTVLNAYVTPILDRYLSELSSSLIGVAESAKLRIMQSNGGIINLDEARQAGVRCIVSGPAGGVVGASYTGRQAALHSDNIEKGGQLQPGLKLITFDMGGTSTDVSLVAQQPVVSTESIVGGLPIGIPMLDIHTIGAGGGSVARIDLGGVLRVGPESAGAEPGPACYAFGDPDNDLPTVTDANVVLGRLPVDYFLGGQMQLDQDRSRQVMAKLGAEIGLDAEQTARGVIEVVNAHMERALRLVTVERGYDPEEFYLLSFGGAGGLHAATLARRLSIPSVIIPPLASTLSAFGMLVADVVRNYSQTVMYTGAATISQISAAYQPLVERGKRDLQSEGFSSGDIRLETSLDIRYRGQSYELEIPFSDDFREDFHQAHHRLYGYSHTEGEIEIVNIRLRAVGVISPPDIPSIHAGDNDPSSAILGERLIILDGQKISAPLFHGEHLQPGNLLKGPAVVVRSDTTILLPRYSSANIDRFGNMLITIDTRGQIRT